MVTNLFRISSATTGVVGKEKITYSIGNSFSGTIHPLSREDYIKRYSSDSYRDNSNYTLLSIESLNIGNILYDGSKFYKVIGFLAGRYRNTADIQEVTNVKL